MAPALGDEPVTGRSGEPSTRLTTRPAASSFFVAASSDIPVTSGTATRSGPLETVTGTVLPTVTCPPPGGLVRMTWPWGTVSLNTSCSAAASPTALRAALASANDLPRTSGTATTGGPVETTTSTGLNLGDVWPCPLH